LQRVLRLERAVCWDADPARAASYAEEMSRALAIPVSTAGDPGAAALQCEVCVTCTPSRRPFLRPEHVRPGPFIAALGADDEGKQELDAPLLASSKLVADVPQ